ncbi:uncharacterized protein LOC143188164 isoform X2 [Calliopsis andreniformis]|uniref:uncharacterized protein LOC143188164 isoform X2 n=1 Tax=Calliopsis andreniformis TaxID=337506 RepID=UPI003FCE8940
MRFSEHEYEPIAPPSASPRPALAPVVRITDTDVVPVADSDDSIDDRARLPPELTRAGDVRVPLDGKIEDTAMEGRELVETGDTSEEQETPQQLQDRLEERFLSAPTPGAESRTDGEVNTSQVDSLALEELPLRRGARGLPQKLKTQAGKLRTRLKNIQRPTFAFTERQKSEKPRSTSSGRSDRSRSEKRPSRMDRIRSSISEHSKFSLPNRPRFSLPDRSKFHLPERPKFNLPERPKFHLPERPKFNIKKPNIRLPNSLTRAKKSPVHDQPSTDSTVGSTRRNIFDFSTYPRIFDRKSKIRGEYATSTPKDSRAQSAESSTFPRTRKGVPMNERWAQRYEEPPYIDEDRSDAEPRVPTEVEEEAEIPWEEKRRQQHLQYMDYEQESTEMSASDRQPHPDASRTEEEFDQKERTDVDPKVYGVKETEDMEEDAEEWVEKREDFRPIQRSRSLEEVLRSREEEGYDGPFGMVDPRMYGVHKTPSEEEEYEEEMEEEEEPLSGQSDKEQQHSSGSSCDRRRRGVIEEIDSDEFFLRESGLSQDDMNLGKYLTHEIRDALRADMTNALADEDMVPIPPKRPMRKRVLRKQKEDSIESYDMIPPVRPKRDPNRARRSESIEEQFRERTRSDSRHRVVYQTEGEPQDLPQEPLDDIVVVKPVRRKSRSSLRSQSLVPQDAPRPPSPTPPPPMVPTRRKRLRKGTPAPRSSDVAPICNGHSDWADSAPEKPLPLTPTELDQLPDEVYTAEEIMAVSEENLQKRLQDEEYMEPAPVPPKRRSRSRGTSVAQDEDRTSHGAESLPEAGYVEEDIPRDDMDFGRDLSGYAIIEKREKPPRPPPPRRKRDKFATTPRQVPPKRPQRAYSTLGPGKTTDSFITETFVTALEPAESTPYIEIDSDDGEHKDLRSSEVLSKMQRRPLPAPPRPPRARKDQSLDRSVTTTQELMQEYSMQETTTATQTDPLPDDMVIEEEVTQAKLVVAPSRSGSQIMISTERIPTPSSMPTPPVPPLPLTRLRKEDQPEPPYDTVSLKSPSPTRELEALEDRHLSAPHLEEPRDEDARLRSIRSALMSEEPVRISNLEVGDLRVDRLSVSQIEAGKIVASEVDALVITASELKNMGALEESLSPSIIRELMAIRSHLETVALSRAQESREAERKAKEDRKTDIPVTESQSVEEKPLEEVQRSTAEEKSEDQKVVSKVIEPTDRELPKPTPHTLTVSQVEIEEPPVTLSVSRIEPSDRDIPSTHSLEVVEATEDKSLRILDSESPLCLSLAKELTLEDPLTTPPVATTEESTVEPRLSPDPATEAASEQTEGADSQPPPEFSKLAAERREEESSADGAEQKPKRKSRSRSPSPIDIPRTRQTASPVRSLPPAISVTPDTPDSVASHTTSEVQPQRAVISYSSYAEQYEGESLRESSQSPMPTFPLGGTHLIAFPASQVPSQFLSLAAQTGQRLDSDPSVVESARELLRVLRLAGIKAMRHFVGYMSSVVGEDSREKIREVELTLCALLLLVIGLLIFFFTHPRTVTHHHHWDYFNPPK